MNAFIPSGGKEPDEIRRIALDSGARVDVYVRVTVRDFQSLCDSYGHTVRIDLPGQICGRMRACSGCKCAEVLRTPNLTDAVIVGGFDSGRGAAACDRDPFCYTV